MDISKADWSLFKAKIPQWQEAYMNRLNQEYLAILSSDKSPSDKFWALEQRIRRDKRSPGVQIQLRRSEMHWNLFEHSGRCDNQRGSMRFQQETAGSDGFYSFKMPEDASRRR